MVTSHIYTFLILETWRPWVKGVSVPAPLGENTLRDVLWESARQQNLPTDRSKEMPGNPLGV